MNVNLGIAPGPDTGTDVRPGLLEGMTIASPPPAHEPMGFFTDSTVCIGCKACEVACKQWNALPADGMDWSGQSYDNTLHLSATTWRHVSFTEHALPDGGAKAGDPGADHLRPRLQRSAVHDQTGRDVRDHFRLDKPVGLQG